MVVTVQQRINLKGKKMQDNGSGEFTPKSVDDVLSMASVANIGSMEHMKENKPGKYDNIYNRKAYHNRMNVAKGVAKKIPSLFIKGEEVEVKGSLFKITAIGNKTMTLQLLPKPKDNGEDNSSEE